MTVRKTHDRSKFLPYLEGGLPPAETEKLASHLETCARCRAEFAALRDGHTWALKLKDAAGDMAGIPSGPLTDFAPASTSPSRSRWMGPFPRLAASAGTRAVWILGAIVLVQFVLLAATNFDRLSGRRNEAPQMDFSSFRALTIQEVPSNTEPHIVTQGYVQEVWQDAHEDTLHFKLVADPHDPGAFVVCEILASSRIAAPRQGNFVRVYGISRYDAQQGREWHEVNPVLNLAVLKH